MTAARIGESYLVKAFKAFETLQETFEGEGALEVAAKRFYELIQLGWDAAYVFNSWGGLQWMTTAYDDGYGVKDETQLLAHSPETPAFEVVPALASDTRYGAWKDRIGSPAIVHGADGWPVLAFVSVLYDGHEAREVAAALSNFVLLNQDVRRALAEFVNLKEDRVHDFLLPQDGEPECKSLDELRQAVRRALALLQLHDEQARLSLIAIGVDPKELG